MLQTAQTHEDTRTIVKCLKDGGFDASTGNLVYNALTAKVEIEGRKYIFWLEDETDIE